MPSSIAPDSAAVDMVERSGTGAHRKEKITPGPPDARPSYQLGHRRVGARNVGAEKLAHRGQRKPAAPVLLEYSDRRQSSHQSIECGRICLGHLGEIGSGSTTAA